MKTEIASGIVLDWFVAECLGLDVGFVSGRPCHWKDTYVGMDDFMIPKYSSDWSVGGPLVAQFIGEGMDIVRVDPAYVTLPKYRATMDKWHHTNYNNDFLECVMICYVSSKLGYELDVPKQLLEYAYENK